MRPGLRFEKRLGYSRSRNAPGFEVGEAIGVEAVEELAGLWAAHDQLAERGHVDQPGGGVHRELGANVLWAGDWRRAYDYGDPEGEALAVHERRASSTSRRSAR